MTVQEVLNRINNIEKTIQFLEGIASRHELKGGEAVTITDAVDMLDEYAAELGRKKVV